MKNKYPGAFWPNESQELLLKVALGSTPESRLRAWHQWKKIKSTDEIERNESKIFPTIYKFLSSHLKEDTFLKKVKGHYLHSWYINQHLVHEAIPIIKELQNAGIKVMIIKGISLYNSVYEDLGARSVGDIDILIPTRDAPRAIKIMELNGWKSNSNLPWEPLLIHAYGFFNSKGQSIDLHWHLLHQCCYDNADNLFWGKAEKITFFSIEVYGLCYTDMLFQCCVHATLYTKDRPNNYNFIDAHHIIRDHGGAIEWDRLIHLCKECSLILPVYYVLHYMKNEYDIPIPDKVILELQNAQLASSERLEYNLVSNIPVSDFKANIDIAKVIYLRSLDRYRREGGKSLFLANINFIRSWRSKSFIWIPLKILRRLFLNFIRMITGNHENRT